MEYEKKFRLIPFDLSRAKTPENPSGLEVVTRNNRKVSIIDTHRRGQCPIIAYVETTKGDSVEDDVISYDVNGKWDCYESNLDLSLKEPLEQRRMTKQELAWWLRDCPEEHREYIYVNTDGSEGLIQHELAYSEEDADEIADSYLIRRNGGEWEAPITDD